MPQRQYSNDYVSPQFNVPRTEMQQVTLPGAPQVPAPVISGDPSWRDNLIAQFLEQGARVASKAADLEYINAYLDGTAQAGIAQSEQELETDFVTKNWKIAGYRDMNGKLALANMQSQFMTDLNDLREKPPEELQKYLAQKRQEILPTLEGMSREQRAAMAGELAAFNRAAIKQHTVEHSKWIVQQKVKGIQAIVGTNLAQLKDLQLKVAAGESSTEAFQESMRAAAVGIVGAIWKDPGLPEEAKAKLLSETVQLALQQDITPLYDYLASNAISGEEDKGSILSRLSLEDQQKLAGNYREALSRNRDAHSLYQMQKFAELNAQIEKGEFNGTYEDLLNFLNPLVINKTISGERREAVIEKYLSKRYDTETDASIAQAYMSGDINAITALGKSPRDAANAVEKVFQQQQIPIEQQYQFWVKASLAGSPGAPGKAAELAKVSLQQMRSPEYKPLPQHIEMFRSIDEMLQTAKSRGDNYTVQEVLSALPENDRTFFMRVQEYMREGATLEGARARALDLELKENNTPASIKVAQSAAKISEINNSIDSLEPRGVISTVWGSIKSLFSQKAEEDMKLRPKDFKWLWQDTSASATYYSQLARESLREEANAIITAHPELSSENVIDLARTKVLERTVSTKYGPVILPRGANVSQAFGVPPSQASLIGPALEEMFKPSKDGASINFLFNSGRLYAQEVDDSGVPVGPGVFVNPEDVQKKVQELTQRKSEEAKGIYGTGREFAFGGIRLSVNGKNTAGVPETWMFDFRKDLLKHEGVTDIPYKDTVGVTTVGVGIAEHNPYFPKDIVEKQGRVPREVIEQSFSQASNDAAASGYKIARDLGFSTPEAFKLFASISYQSGPSWYAQKGTAGEKYREFISALKAGDKEYAKEVFKQTPAYVYSGPKDDLNKKTTRRSYYLSLIDNVIGG